jgi:hypothetical protein
MLIIEVVVIAVVTIAPVFMPVMIATMGAAVTQKIFK